MVTARNETSKVSLHEFLTWACSDLPFSIDWWRKGDDGLNAYHRSAASHPDGSWGVFDIIQKERVTRSSWRNLGDSGDEVETTLHEVKTLHEAVLSVYAMSGEFHPEDILNHVIDRHSVMLDTQPELLEFGGYCYYMTLEQKSDMMTTLLEIENVYTPVSTVVFDAHLLPAASQSVIIDGIKAANLNVPAGVTFDTEIAIEHPSENCKNV